MKVVIIVDMQNDFVTGDLGTNEAKAIVPKVVTTMNQYASDETLFLFTKDTHATNYMNTLEGKKLPIIHCIEETEGWEIVPEIAEAYANIYDKVSHLDKISPVFNGYTDIIDKPTFGSIDLQNILYEISDHRNIEEIIFMGVCTSICVLSNVILTKATLPETSIKVIKDCCACVTPETHKNALRAMEMCQIEII